MRFTYLFFVLLLLSVSFAGLTLDKVVSDFGWGCQYYTYTNDLMTAKSVAVPTAEFDKASADIESRGWEILTEVDKTREVWDTSLNCHIETTKCPEEDPKNETGCTPEDIEVCGAFRTENYKASEYLPFTTSKQLPTGKTKVRFCADYEMKKTADGWGFSGDMIPTFDGVRYPEFAWWNASWLYRAPCYINTTVSSSLTNFPAHCILDTQSLISAGKMNTSCQDLRMANSSENALPYEIENNTCNTTTTVIWVGVPATNATGNDTVYIYYGNPTAADGQNVSGVWTSYGDVWHFTNTSNRYESSTGGISFAISSTLVSATCRYGTCMNATAGLVTNTTSYYSMSGAENLTATCWSYTAGTSGYGDILAQRSLAGSGNWCWVRKQTTNVLDYYNSVVGEVPTTKTFTINTPQHTGIVQDGTTIKQYYNGTLNLSTVGGYGAASSDLTVGRAHTTSEIFTGTIDECRITKGINGNKSADWIKAEYAQTDSIGAEESGATSTNISDCTNLNIAGQEYNLTADITNAGGSCMNVSANNIVLDLKGYTIDGTNVSGKHGINASAVSNFTVKNGKVQEFEYNIIFRDSLNMNVLNMTTEHGRQSEAAFTNSNYTNVSNCTFLNSYYTAIETTGFNLSLSDTVITGGGRGVVMNGGGGNHTINRVNISGIDYKGFDLWGNATTGFISNIIVHDTGETCIDLDNVSGFNLTNITIYDCGNEYAQIDTPYTSYWTNVFIGNTSTLGANWSAFNISAKNITEGTNIHIHEDFVSLDASALTELKDGATITITTDASCVNDSYFLKTGFPTSKADILTGTRQGIASCAGGVASFYASSFSGYAMGDPITFSTSFKATSNETDNNTMTVSASHASESITAYSILIQYNNTDVLQQNETGINNASLSFSQPIIAPLVAVNETDVEYFVYLNLTYGTTDREESSGGNQSVWTYYIPGVYSSSAWASVWEASRNLTITIPSKPTLAPVLATHTFAGANDLCTEIYANGTLNNETECNSTITAHSSSLLELGASHYMKAGVIALDYWPDITYNLSFDETPESTSSKQVSLTRANKSREGLYWLVNLTNGTINGTANISSIVLTKFYDSDSLAALNIDSASMTYTLHFADGESKTFFIGYVNTSLLANASIKAYPNTTIFNISSIESYSKSGYRTSARFLVYANTSTATNQNVSVYLIAENVSTYALIDVIDNGAPVQSAYVAILKYYTASSEYIQVDERTTNSDGRAGTYIDPSSFYKFVVYSSTGELLYYSASPEQFICESVSLCEITINIGDQIPVSLFSPHGGGICYGVNATNTIVFAYADGSGQTSSVNFLAYRENNSAPVCNYSVDAASASYSCVLSPPENLSSYLYSCQVWRTASPSWLDYVALIDYRAFIGVVDWFMAAITIILVISVSAFSMAIGVGLAGISLFALSAMGIIQIPTGVSISIMIVGFVLAFLLAKRGET